MTLIINDKNINNKIVKAIVTAITIISTLLISASTTIVGLTIISGTIGIVIASIGISILGTIILIPVAAIINKITKKTKRKI